MHAAAQGAAASLHHDGLLLRPYPRRAVDADRHAARYRQGVDSSRSREIAGMPRLDRYQDRKVYDALAGDYVLGTMGGRARRRFLELMAERGYIREAAGAWERRLHPLGLNIIPITPHPRVWRK